MSQIDRYFFFTSIIMSLTHILRFIIFQPPIIIQFVFPILVVRNYKYSIDKLIHYIQRNLKIVLHRNGHQFNEDEHYFKYYIHFIIQHTRVNLRHKKKKEKLTDHKRRNCKDDKKGQRVIHRKKIFLLNNTNVKCKNVNTN